MATEPDGRGTLPAAAPPSRRLTVVAQDPRFRPEGRIVRAQVTVPADWLEPGPRGQRFHVVDYDATTGTFQEPVDLTDQAAADGRGWTSLDAFERASDAELLSNPAFHAQNVYAIAARTLAAFEAALGRRLGWAFGGHQLFLVPHAFAEANAYYAGDDRAVYFGYLEDEQGRPVHTCLSHDIVAHEVTHAILDGLRPRFIEPSLPDQAAFHEAFADVVALLSVFSIPELVEAALGPADERGRIKKASTSRRALARTTLFGLAEQFGETVSGVRGSALRRSLDVPLGSGWAADPVYEEPHRRGEIVVAAVLRSLLDMWAGRLKGLGGRGGLDRARVADEGAKAARHLLEMVIRATDYAPAVELEFADFLEALLVADEVVAPDDPHAYRQTVEAAFGAYGIERPAGRIVDVSLLPLTYGHLHFDSLRSDEDEVFRFIWQNAETLGIDSSQFLRVDAVRPSTRVGPDGLVVNEVVADYVQTLTTTAARLADDLPQVTVPEGVPPDTDVQLWGGGTLVFDQFGKAKFHHRKPLEDWERQTRRLAFLARSGYFDSRGRLGFSFGTPLGMRFAEFHERDVAAGEDW